MGRIVVSDRFGSQFATLVGGAGDPKSHAGNSPFVGPAKSWLRSSVKSNVGLLAGPHSTADNKLKIEGIFGNIEHKISSF
jgi:hypothetical protein